MDAPMIDQPANQAELTVLREEDDLRHIARHVKTYIPGHDSSGSIDEDSNKLISLYENIIHTCFSNSLDAGHRVAAWNALCALIDQTIDSPHEAVRLILWQAQIWNRSLRLYLDQSHNARPKSSKQLLTSLSNVLRKSEDAPWIGDLKSELSLHLVRAVGATEVQRDSKAYLLLFTHLLSKNIISLDNFLSRVGEVNDSIDTNDELPALLSAVFHWTAKGDFGSIIGQLIAVILDKLDKKTSAASSDATKAQEDASVPIWSKPLHETLGRNLENTEAYRSHIFPVLFKRSLPQYAAFLKQLGLEQMFNSEKSTCNDNTTEMLYAALQTGKSLGMIEEANVDDIVLESNRILIPIPFIARLISSGDRSARLTGLSLFISSLSPTKPFEPAVLEQLKNALSHLHADTDAFFRSELFSLSQRLFDRMRAVTASLARMAGNPTKSSAVSASLEEHKAFIHWYLQFIAWELRPTSSYQRHISALKCLSLLLRSGVDSNISQNQLSKSASGNAQWPFQIAVIDAGLHRLLLDLLMDPYDDVRQASAGILELSTAANKTNNTTASLEYAKERAVARMFSSGRADHADGVAYIHSLSYVLASSPESRQHVLTALLDKTEEMLHVADNELARAVEKFPLHGLLTSLRYVLLRYNVEAGVQSGLYERVEKLLQHVWTVVKPTLCDDAPEGHMPDEMDDVPDISSKDILSYCWRALKEASLLMGTMLSPPLLKTCGFSADFKRSIFGLCFKQLSELRHRGAFSTVAQTWTACCLLMETGDSPLSLSAWYERTIGLLRGSLTINTRRSAGLPSLLCGVLIADRSGTLFKRAFAEFEQIARDTVDSGSAQEGSLPQVHAMNCMKDVLKNTRLAEKSEQYVPVALRLAADSLRSEAWAIRNCGLMLFRAVIDRLLGTNDAYLEDEVATKRRVDFEQHQDLLELVIGLLSTAPTSSLPGEGARNEGVFPALQLLQRAQMPEVKRMEVQTAVFALTGSPSWHVRDKAARTFVSFVPVDTTASVLEQLLTARPNDHNALHGSLFCALHIIRRLRAKIIPLSASVPEYSRLSSIADRCKQLVVAAEGLRLDESCLYTSIAFVDVEIAVQSLDAVLHNRHEVPATAGQGFTPGSTIALEGDHASSPSPTIGRLGETEIMKSISHQTEADQWLEERASHLENEAVNALDATLLTNLQEWARAAQTSLDDASIFSRQAAVQGLSHFTVVWPKLAAQPEASSLFLSLTTTVYDLLNDDEEDIRVPASHAACRILAACDETESSSESTSTTLVPLIAAERLTDLLVKRWPESTELFNTAIVRAFSASSSSVESQLCALENDQHALFAEEKQNLYIDEAREVQIWSQVAMQLSLPSSSSPALQALTHWTISGLKSLQDKFSANPDGPLGWNTNEKAFLLGLQVVHAAEVLLTLVEKDVKLGAGKEELSRSLAELVNVAREGEGNALWLREGERVQGRRLEEAAVK
ncbi:hypothetical protein Q7P37_007645 [Cladosporium fusiforme]